MATLVNGALALTSPYGIWTPNHTIFSPFVTPQAPQANFVRESLLRDRQSQQYINFTVPATINNGVGFPIDPTNVRSINEDVLLADYSPFHRQGATPEDLTTSVLNLLGHGAPIYITSPDISSLNSLSLIHI